MLHNAKLKKNIKDSHLRLNIENSQSEFQSRCSVNRL